MQTPQQIQEMDSEYMHVAALGQPFKLGMLYDVCKDELFPGLMLWDEKTLQENTTEYPHQTREYKTSFSDTIESKSSMLDVGTSLKASVLSGLIDVGGSAKYLTDKKRFQNQCRVTFKSKVTTTFEQLFMTHLMTMDPTQMDIIQKNSATHLVTGILYGANSFYVFDSKKLEASSVRQIKGQMEAVIMKIPMSGVKGNVDIKLTDEEKTLTNSFSCKFYEDVSLHNNTATFEEAVMTQLKPPQLLGEKEGKGIPQKVWLMPLKKLDSKAKELVSGISEGLVLKAQEALEDLRETEMRCNDCLQDRVVPSFPQIDKWLRKFQTLCLNYEAHLKQTMAEKFPLIREGKEDESSVQKLLDDRKESPFSQENLKKWLDLKEREITVIGSCVDAMDGAAMVRSQTELDREVLSAAVDQVLCFVFTSIGSADPCLEAIANYSSSPRLAATDHKEPWCCSDEVLTKMKEKAKAFGYITKALKNNKRFRFLIASLENQKYTGATICHYSNGRLVTDDFSKMDVPAVESISNRGDLMWYACDLTLDPNTVNKQLTLSDGNKKVTFARKQTPPEHPERFECLPQVLCKEGLDGRCYWELKLSDSSQQDVLMAVTYKEIARKNKTENLGSSALAWSLSYFFFEPEIPEPFLTALHGQEKVPVPPTGSSRIGVYLDWPAGTLSFYSVSSDTLTHLYTFRTRFKNPVYPGFRICCPGNFVALCPFE